MGAFRKGLRVWLSPNQDRHIAVAFEGKGDRKGCVGRFGWLSPLEHRGCKIVQLMSIVDSGILSGKKEMNSVATSGRNNRHLHINDQLDRISVHQYKIQTL